MKTEQEILDENVVRYIGTSVLQILKADAKMQAKDLLLTELLADRAKLAEREQEIVELKKTIESKNADINAIAEQRDILDVA